MASLIMKLISLNIWGGKIFDPLIEFFRERAHDTDIFCLQEVVFGTEPRVTSDGVHEHVGMAIQNALPDFILYPALAPEGTHFMYANLGQGVRVGQALFMRKTFDLCGQGSFETCHERSSLHPLTGRFQYVEFDHAGQRFVVGNIHGAWQASGKGDTPERIEQAHTVRTFLDGKPGKKIIAGDFNLSPQSESVKFLGNGMRNLIAEYGVRTTRSHFYMYAEKYNDYISDYIFVSPDMKVQEFRVIDNPISDHFPLVLEFSS